MKAFAAQKIFSHGAFRAGYVLVDDAGCVADVVADLPAGFSGEVVDLGERELLPGLVDCHVHINEPGRTEWEGFRTATQAAAAGGITTLVDMPLNCIPVTTTRAALQAKVRSLADQLWVDCGFWGGVTPDNLTELADLCRAGILGAKSFLIDSGIPEFGHVNFDQVALAMPILRDAGLPYLFHAEWEHAPAQEAVSSYADFVASRPASWEDRAIERLIELCAKIGGRVHIVHLSSASALPAIREAKAAGLPITVETCPHYLCFDAEQIGEEALERQPLYKCCPPIRDQANQAALWEAVADDTIDFIVSDHSPCTLELKHLAEGDLARAWGGIMGLQAGFVAVRDRALKQGLAATQVITKMTAKPAEFVGLQERKGSIEAGADADFLVFDPAGTTTLQPQDLLQRNKASPFAGLTYGGAIASTYLRGECVYEQGKVQGEARGQPLGLASSLMEER